MHSRFPNGKQIKSEIKSDFSNSDFELRGNIYIVYRKYENVVLNLIDNIILGKVMLHYDQATSSHKRYYFNFDSALRLTCRPPRSSVRESQFGKFCFRLYGDCLEFRRRVLLCVGSPLYADIISLF